jgi:hypothetical protein
MGDGGAGAAGSVVSLEPKAKVKPEVNDPLERAGHLILDMIGKAASTAEVNYQQAVEMSRKLSAQLRGAQDRIRELEAQVFHHQDRADRAERWLYQISVDVEQKFFGRDDSRASQPPPPQAVSRNQPR